MTVVTNDTSEQPLVRRQVRLALVMNGGVSLAIWIGGVTYEVDCLRRASRECRATPETATSDLYRKLLAALQQDVRVDVLSGASAGGINGALLAAAIAWDGYLPNLRDTWVNLGDLGAMVRSPGESDPPSVLRGDEYALPQMERVFADLHAHGHRTEPSGKDSPVYLFLTGTGLRNPEREFSDSTGVTFMETDPRIVFRFEHDPTPASANDLMAAGLEEEADQGVFPARVNLLAPEAPRLLARAARATSSFPAAFEPHDIRISRFGQERTTPVIDGGVLDNQPFNPLLNQTALLPADVPVRRVVGYVVPYITSPDAEKPSKDGEQETEEKEQEEKEAPEQPPTLREVIWAASSLPRELPKLESLTRVRQDYRAATEAEQARKRVLVAARDDGMKSVAGSLLPMYRLTRHRSVLLLLRETRRREFEPGTGPAGGDETRDLQSLPPIAKVDDGDPDPNDVPDLPWLPDSWPTARDVLAGEKWNWGLAPAERLAAHALSCIRDLAATESRKPKLDRAYWEILAKARECAGELLRDVRVASMRFRTALRADGVVAAGMSDEELLEAAKSAYERVGTAALLGRVKNLSKELNAVRITPQGRHVPTIKQLLDVEIVTNAVAPTASAFATPFEFLHMSAKVSNALGHKATTPDEKLAGMKLGHFAGFLKRSWRANDWLWGRLDGVEHLLNALLDVEHLRRLEDPAFEALIPKLTALAFPIDDAAVRETLIARWKEAPADGGVKDFKGEPTEEFAEVLKRAREKAETDHERPGRDEAAPYMCRVRSALAAPIQLAILREELARVAEAAVADGDAGADGAAAGLEWGRAVIATPPRTPQQLVERFHDLSIGQEQPADELDSRLGLGLVSRIVPVAVAGLAGERGGLPGIVRGALATARGTTLILGNLTRLAAQTPALGALLLIALIGVVAWGLAAPQTLFGALVSIAALGAVVLAMLLLTLFLNSLVANRESWRIWLRLVLVVALPLGAGLLLLFGTPDLPGWLDWLEAPLKWVDDHVGDTLSTIAAIFAFSAALAAVGCAICRLRKATQGMRVLLKVYRWLVFIASLLVATGVVYSIVIPEKGLDAACADDCPLDEWQGAIFISALLVTMIAAAFGAELWADIRSGLRTIKRQLVGP